MDADNLVTLCAWSNTVRHEGEWMSFEKYLERRFGVVSTHGISPKAMEKLDAELEAIESGGGAGKAVLRDPKRLAALKSTGLLDSPAIQGFDRISRLGAALLHVPATFISLVDDDRDFYLSHCGFGEPLATERQLKGETFCHFAIQSERPLVIPDTLADPIYARVPTVQSLGVRAYLGVPLVMLSGEVIGAFCAIDFVAHDWTESDLLAATDLAALVISEIELRQAALDFQRKLQGA